MTNLSNPKFAWMDGLVPWEDATCHISSLAFKYGAAVFEGIRAYWNSDREELVLWQAGEHLARLERSQHFMRFANPVKSRDALAAIKELLKANATRADVHITVTAFLSGHGQPFVCEPVSLAITAMERPDYTTDGLDVQVSSWRKPSDTALPQRVKANGNYLNGRLASIQARHDGYDTAILLNDRGQVAEGPSMCFFMVRDGIVVTPDSQAGILESITRETLLVILREDNIPVEVRPVDRSELPFATEAFFCGTGWEIAPIKSIDGQTLRHANEQPLTEMLRNRFRELATGNNPSHPEWRVILKHI